MREVACGAPLGGLGIGGTFERVLSAFRLPFLHRRRLLPGRPCLPHGPLRGRRARADSLHLLAAPDAGRRDRASDHRPPDARAQAGLRGPARPGGARPPQDQAGAHAVHHRGHHRHLRRRPGRRRRPDRLHPRDVRAGRRVGHDVRLGRDAPVRAVARPEGVPQRPLPVARRPHPVARAAVVDLRAPRARGCRVGREGHRGLERARELPPAPARAPRRRARLSTSRTPGWRRPGPRSSRGCRRPGSRTVWPTTASSRAS